MALTIELEQNAGEFKGSHIILEMPYSNNEEEVDEAFKSIGVEDYTDIYHFNRITSFNLIDILDNSTGLDNKILKANLTSLNLGALDTLNENVELLEDLKDSSSEIYDYIDSCIVCSMDKVYNFLNTLLDSNELGLAYSSLSDFPFEHYEFYNSLEELLDVYTSSFFTSSTTLRDIRKIDSELIIYNELENLVSFEITSKPDYSKPFIFNISNTNVDDEYYYNSSTKIQLPVNLDNKEELNRLISQLNTINLDFNDAYGYFHFDSVEDSPYGGWSLDEFCRLEVVNNNCILLSNPDDLAIYENTDTDLVLAYLLELDHIDITDEDLTARKIENCVEDEHYELVELLFDDDYFTGDFILKYHKNLIDWKRFEDNHIRDWFYESPFGAIVEKEW